MKTFEQYLKENYESGIIDHSIRAEAKSNGDVTFYIHASNYDSDTLDFQVRGNCLSKSPYVIRMNDID